MVQLYGQDKATGKHAETALEMRWRMVSNEGQETGDPTSGNTIDGIDFMVSHNEVTLENFESI